MEKKFNFFVTFTIYSQNFGIAANILPYIKEEKQTGKYIFLGFLTNKTGNLYFTMRTERGIIITFDEKHIHDAFLDGGYYIADKCA